MKWSMKPLGKFCILTNGKAFKADDWSESGLPIIRIQNLNDSTKPFNHWDGPLERQVYVQPGDLLIAWSGTPGTSFGAHIWRGSEGVLNQHIFKVDLKNGEVTKEWLKFCVNKQLLQLIDQSHGGVGLKHVTKGAVEAIQIPLPSLAEQKRIATILDAADALRAKRRESLAQLDTLLQSTFLDMFGDPVTNPKGWEQVELSTLIDSMDKINYGVVQPGGDYPSGRPLIRVGDFAGGVLNLSDVKLIDPEIEKVYRRSRLNGRELLVSCVGSIGTVCKVSEREKGFNIARAVARIPLEETINRDFMLYCLRSASVQRHFLKETRTVSQPTLNIGLIKSALVIQPPSELQHRFATIVESVEQQKARLRAHLAELDTLFASLQSRAFKGEL